MAINTLLLRPLAKLKTQLDPTTIPDLELWLDAADSATVSLDGSNNVQEWQDKSGNNLHATQTTAANRPDYSGTLNGKKVIGFAGSPECLIAPNPTSGGIPRTVILVTKYSSSPSNTFHILSLSHAITNGQSWILTTEIGVRCFNVIRIFGGGQSNTPQILSITQTGDNSNTLSAHINGSPQTPTNTIAGTINSTSSNIGLAFNGNTTTPQGHLSGDLAEVLIFSRALTESERSSIEKYLSSKWGVTLI